MFTKDKSFYRSFFALALTLMLEQAVILSVNLVDNLMLGNYSEVALSGVAAVNQIQFVLQCVIGAIVSGMVVLGSQYLGSGDRETVRKICSMTLWLGCGVALLLFLTVSLFPRFVLGLFTKDAAIAAEGMRYLSLMRFSYLLFAATSIFLGMMRIGETVRIALIVSCISLVINCSINYVLISGRWGFPEWGAVGAAVGTVTARAVEFVIVVIYLFRREKVIRIRPKELLRFEGKLFPQYVRVSTPVLMTGVIWGGWNALQTMVLGHMDDSAIAAQSISSTVFLLLKVTAVGASSAATVITGKLVGSGAELPKIKEYSRTMQALFIGAGLLTGAVMFCARGPILSIYDVSGETSRMAELFMIIQAAVLFFTAYQMPCDTGIVRGGGDTRFAMILDISLIVLLEIPFTLLSAFVWRLSPVWVFIILNLDQAVKCIPAGIYTNSYRWIRRLSQGMRQKGERDE